MSKPRYFKITGATIYFQLNDERSDPVVTFENSTQYIEDNLDIRIDTSVAEYFQRNPSSEEQTHES